MWDYVGYEYYYNIIYVGYMLDNMILEICGNMLILYIMWEYVDYEICWLYIQNIIRYKIE